MLAKFAVALVALLAFTGQAAAQIITDQPDPHSVYIRIAYHDSGRVVAPGDFPKDMIEPSRMFAAIQARELAKKGFILFNSPCAICFGGTIIDFYADGTARVRFKDAKGKIHLDRRFRFAEPVIAFNSGGAKRARPRAGFPALFV